MHRSFPSYLVAVFFLHAAWTYIYIYTVDARTSSRLNEERRKGRKKGGNEDEEGSLSKKLTVYKKYAKESFCVATKRTCELLLLGTRRKRKDEDVFRLDKG